jgi:hypothetical protein
MHFEGCESAFFGLDDELEVEEPNSSSFPLNLVEEVEE